ncbi:MAG: hypothetical protein ACLPUX_10155, partial [Syntrophobacteraceae bacterium]
DRREFPRLAHEALLPPLAPLSGSSPITALLLAPLSEIMIQIKSSADQARYMRASRRVSLRLSSIAPDARRRRRGSQKQRCRFKATGALLGGRSQQ